MSEEPMVDMLFGPGDSFRADCSCPASPKVVLTIHGDIDLVTEERFAEHLRHHLHLRTQAPEVTVDLTAVTFISARGISILAEAADQALRLDIAFTMVGCSPWTSRIITMWQTLAPSAMRLV